MLQMFRVHRARKAAVQGIEPLVAESRQRLRGIPDHAWLDPYMVGFMGMLISLIARREAPGLSSQATGLVQQEAWSDITGCPRDLVGEEICLLSLEGNASFNQGCNAAIRLFDTLQTAPASTVPDWEQLPQSAAEDGVAALWAEVFESHLPG